MIVIAIIIGVALIITAVLILPSVSPVGEVVMPDLVDRPLEDGNALGDPDAPVVVEVFEDFQCPACRNFSDEIEPLIVDKFVTTGDIRYIYRHYPFIDDRAPTNESDQAANASMCAAEQDRFWDYHDVLFANWNGENRGAFSDRRLIAFAENLNLDMTAFEACFKENRYQEEINQDFLAGRNSGISGTPSVLVNGQRVGDPGFVPSYEQIERAIEAELADLGR
jgi:protein-disulfide isomerase